MALRLELQTRFSNREQGPNESKDDLRSRDTSLRNSCTSSNSALNDEHARRRRISMPDAASSPLLCDVLASATAGIISRCFTHPLDTAKARLQAPGNALFKGPIDTIVKTFQHQGVRGLYGGFGAVILGGTPGTVLYLTGYSYCRDKMTALVTGGDERHQQQQLTPRQEFAVHFSCGMLAEAVTCVIYVPVDVIKERLQVQQSASSVGGGGSHYTGSFHALKQIVRTEGVFGIYKGYWATLASFGPFSAIYFMTYEQFKSMAREREGCRDGELSLGNLVASSCCAGALASWLTSPLDMAKLLLQVQRGKAAATTDKVVCRARPPQYQGMIHCLSLVYQNGGIRGLFRGAGARVLHFAPATTITMTCYEKCKTIYSDLLV